MADKADKAETPAWGPENPHPLSQIKTELVWEGKYDEYGSRREVGVAGGDLPLQKVESIDEPRSSAEGKGQTAFDFYKKQSKRQDDFRNMLIWGDNKLVMASLLRDFCGEIDLIYIDPPFDVGADFKMDVPIGDGRDNLAKDQSVLEAVAYRDTWGKGTDSYLHMMYERLALMMELLKETGSIYVHVDWRMVGRLRLVLDDLLNSDSFRNQLVWAYGGSGRGAKAIAGQFPRNHDCLLFYAKSRDVSYIPVYIQRSYSFAEARKAGFRVDGVGRWFKTAPRGDYTDESVARLEAEGRIHRTKSGKIRIKYFLEVEGDMIVEKVMAGDVWTDIPDAMHLPQDERTDYDTQKPEALLERVIRASSKEGDLVGDFFCGSGTMGAVAEKLRRRWIMCDLGRFAIHTSRKRMIEIQRNLYAEHKPYRAFDVYNLGRYERQWWQKERLKGADEEHRKIVLAFYRAELLTDAASPVLHGRKGPAFVHVDGIDSILTLEELKPVVEATQAAGAKEVHCLAWEFEMELKRSAEALEHEYGVKVRLIRIPREVMEKNRRPGVDEVPFFEMATLAAEPIVGVEGGERIVDVKLTNFLPSLSEVPSKELEALQERALKSGFDFIDFWAVDFEHQDGHPFKHHWQDYRLRKDRSLKLQSDCKHKYTDAKAHTICVKVIDTFGCDTSILLDVLGAEGNKGGKK